MEVINQKCIDKENARERRRKPGRRREADVMPDDRASERALFVARHLNRFSTAERRLKDLKFGFKIFWAFDENDETIASDIRTIQAYTTSSAHMTIKPANYQDYQDNFT